MKKIISISLLFVGVLVFILTLPPEMNAISPSHLCKKNEKVYFSCQLKKNKRKIISLCGSKNLSDENGYLKYRFGTKKKIELEYPKSLRNTQKAFQYSSYTRPVQGDLMLTTGYYLDFIIKGYAYQVYQEYASSDKGESHETAGVRLTNGKDIDLSCRLPVTGGLGVFEEIVLSE